MVKNRLKIVEPNLKNNIVSFFIGVIPVSFSLWFCIFKEGVESVREELNGYSIEEQMVMQQESLEMISNLKFELILICILLLICYISFSILVGYLIWNSFNFLKKMRRRLLEK